MLLIKTVSSLVLRTAGFQTVPSDVGFPFSSHWNRKTTTFCVSAVCKAVCQLGWFKGACNSLQHVPSISLEVNHHLKGLWFLLDDDKPSLKLWCFGNQPIKKKGDWTSMDLLYSLWMCLLRICISSYVPWFHTVDILVVRVPKQPSICF